VYVLQNVNVNIPENYVYENVIMFFVSFLFGYFFRQQLGWSGETETKAIPYQTTNPNKVDDLKRIEGIGPAIEKILNSNNIKSYNDLANAKVDDLKNILANAGSFFQNHNPSTWGEQAILLRDGKIEEFEKLTKELIAGVRVN
jgi:hypothetical protein